MFLSRLHSSWPYPPGSVFVEKESEQTSKCLALRRQEWGLTDPEAPSLAHSEI